MDMTVLPLPSNACLWAATRHSASKIFLRISRTLSSSLISFRHHSSAVVSSVSFSAEVCSGCLFFEDAAAAVEKVAASVLAAKGFNLLLY